MSCFCTGDCHLPEDCILEFRKELEAFEEKCRTVHILELGHLLATAETASHRRIAERIASERIA